MGQPQEGRTAPGWRGEWPAERRATAKPAPTPRDYDDLGGAPRRGQPVQIRALATVAGLAEVASRLCLENYDIHDDQHYGVAGFWESQVWRVYWLGPRVARLGDLFQHTIAPRVAA